MVDMARRNTGVEGGVGLTALMVAAARAIETHRPDALARDVYAEHFVRAARASAGWPVHPREVPDGDANPLWGRLGRYFGLRTRVLDDFLLRSVRAGIRQVVVLGAGLDARAFRLGWPSGCVVFEIDRAEVLDFKHRVLGGLSAAPRATRVPVAADLAADWAGALTGAGFAPDAPTAWLAEGLLLYLPRAAEGRLIDVVDRLSAGGSAFAFEVKLGARSPEVREDPIYSATRRQLGIDLHALFDGDPRPDSAGDLASRGWSTSVHTPFAFTRRHGRGPRLRRNDALADNRWFFAAKPTTAPDTRSRTAAPSPPGPPPAPPSAS
ncbi:class I SAM-dependent methyltransferase [Streptomyces sp. URMC 129]|uniref:class I SAM-dependent methyltransferase n=1 Tax=Streptomyces sp. URMC 129 TaxID=3423407 RepID=UPI003F19D3CA